ncbi:MAG: CHAP domain-containing protein [Pseudomonadota bacterium]
MAILSRAEAIEAGQYNKKRARRVGWSGRWNGVCQALGVASPQVTPEDFSELVASWQSRHKPLKPDGKLGNETWRRMLPATQYGYGAVPAPHWLPKGPPHRAPVGRVRTTNFDNPWMDIAKDEMTTHWRQGNKPIWEKNSDVDEGYFECCPYFGKRRHEAGAPRNIDNNAWCAAFVNFCLHTAGYSHTGSSGAMSFRKRKYWDFEALPEPKRGCVIVCESGSYDHVAFLDEWGDDDLPANPRGDVDGKRSRKLHLLGGNQSKKGTVNSKSYNTWKLRAAKDKWGNRSPYLWPLQGEDHNCNCELETARPHHCGLLWL